MFTLAISCLTTSNCLDSWTWHSRFLCSIALYSIGPCFYHQSHPQLGGVFALALSLHFFLVIFLHWSPIACWTPTYLGSSSFSVLSFCFFIYSYYFIILSCTLCPPLPLQLTITSLFSVSMSLRFLFLIPHVSEIIWYLSIYDLFHIA